MHDGISKFSTEYNGVYLRRIEHKNQSVNIPYCFSKLRGGVNAFGTGKLFIFRSDHLICINMIAFKDSGFMLYSFRNNFKMYFNQYFTYH